MARYRIVKTRISSSLEQFSIEKYTEKVENGDVTIGDWEYVSDYWGDPLKYYGNFDDAKKELDKIIECDENKIEIVFDTLTYNPTKETGT